MPNKVQFAYYALGSLISGCALALKWRQDEREQQKSDLVFQTLRLGYERSIEQQMRSLLFENLITVRQFDTGSSAEKQLRTELDSLFGKPAFLEVLKELHIEKLKITALVGRLRKLRWVRAIAMAVGVVATSGIVAPWLETLRGAESNFNVLNWVSLVILTEAAAVVVVVNLRLRLSVRQLSSLAALGAK